MGVNASIDSECDVKNHFLCASFKSFNQRQVFVNSTQVYAFLHLLVAINYAH